MIKILNTNKPIYLNEKKFNDWLDKMAHFCQNVYVPVNITDFIKYVLNDDTILNIHFSNEIIRKKYGFYTLDDVKRLIKKAFIIPDYINKSIDECINKQQLINLIREVSGVIGEENSCSRKKVESKITYFVRNMIFDTIVLSDYDYDSLSITLYPEAINEFCNTSTNSLMEVYETEFLERIFNLSHYYFVENDKSKFSDIFKRHDYTSEVVKYSLSTNYMRNYCADYSIDYCEDFWDFSTPLTYPKSGADYISGGMGHFYKIYEASIEDFDKALRYIFEYSDIYADYDGDSELMDDPENPMNIFYDIKNYYTYLKSNSKKEDNVQKKLSIHTTVNYFELFLKETSLLPSTADDYVKRVKRLLKKYYDIDEENIKTLDKAILIKLIENLFELEEGNNLSALRKIYDFLLSDQNKVKYNNQCIEVVPKSRKEQFEQIESSKIEEIKQYITKHLREEYDFEEFNDEYVQNMELNNYNESMNLFVVHPIKNNPIVGSKTLRFDDEQSFQDYVIEVMEQKGFSNSDVYGGKNSIMCKQTLLRVLNDADFIPKKDTVIVICLRLQLNLQDSIQLLNKAGYTLSTAITRDLIIRKLLSDQIYEIDYYNSILDAFGFDVLLGTCKK